MFKLLFNSFRKIIPLSLWATIIELFPIISQLLNNKKRDLLLNYKFADDEYKDEIEYIKKVNKWCMIPYSFVENYKSKDVKVYYDKNEKLKFVMHKGKKLYFPNSFLNKTIQNYYTILLCEQDPMSPHAYCSESFKVETGDIILDVGCAEAIFALEWVEFASEIYLFECNPKWIKALKATFKPYAEKVHIIEKYAGDISNENMITIDEVFKTSEGKSFFIKMDVEGYEKMVLEGALKTIESGNVKCACCTYHRAEDPNELYAFFTRLGYSCEFSKGYICTLIYGETPNFFRRGVIRAYK